MPHSPSRHADHRQSAIARGMMLAHRTTSMTMSLIVPVGAGYWADQRWETTPWLASLGALIGFPLFLMQLVAFADSSKASSGSPTPRRQNNSPQENSSPRTNDSSASPSTIQHPPSE